VSIQRTMKSPRFFAIASLLFCTLLIAGCEAAALPVVPTALPTATNTPTALPSRTPGQDATPTITPTQENLPPTEGPSPTPLFGSPSTSVAVAPTGTRVLNPNAPRIEFFTTDVLAVAPGDTVNLYWSTRGVTSANIYRLERGIRNQLWPVGPDGSLNVPTRRSDRGSVEFLLTVGNGDQVVEQILTIPVACPDVWFFQPAPDDCPAGPAEETSLIEQPFERGRLLYIQSTNLVYALINDGFAPAWISIENRFDPAIHPESDPEFALAVPPGFYQPVRILGFVWRGNDVVRNRLGLAIQPEFSYQGFTQTVINPSGEFTLYVSSSDGTVLQLLPEGELWQIITPP
ncbi:MAG TPA: hypothetical protein VK003_01310, partial [Oceanobacillus sp.]|nr:hypothetical protein [Oceanobacillus sp.]